MVRARCGVQLIDRKSMVGAMCGVQLRDRKSMVGAMCGVQPIDRKIHHWSNVWSTAHRQKDPWWEQCVEYCS